MVTTAPLSLTKSRLASYPYRLTRRRNQRSGFCLALALFIALYIVVAKLVGWLMPDQITLPLIGEVTWLSDLAAGGSVLIMMVLSIFLMAPVASAFIGLFLEEVAEEVEERHYPNLPPLSPKPFSQSVEETIRFFGTVLAANLIALMLLPFFFFMAPFIFLAMNGYLLSREFFQMVATRRMAPQTAFAGMVRWHVARCDLSPGLDEKSGFSA